MTKIFNNLVQNKKIVNILFIFSLTLCVFFTKSNPAHAQVGALTCNTGAIFSALGLGGGGGGATGALGGGAVPISNQLIESNTQAVKNVQCTWNGIAWQLAHIVLHQLTGNIVNWINSGFQGSPAFLTNPTGFFTKVGDDLTGAFIAANGPLQSLCGPFNTNIRLAISNGQSGLYNQPYSCTLSSIINNAQNATINGKSVAGFMNGDFSQGGMAGFVAVGGPSNNPGRVYLQAQSDLAQRVNAKQGQYQSDLLQGSGFLNYKDCKDISEDQVNSSLNDQGIDDYGFKYAAYSGNGKTGIDAGDNSTWYSQNGGNITVVANKDGTYKYQSCQNLTPGSVISSAINKELGAPTDELNLTQDINQVVSALFSQLLTKTLSGGLLKASQSSYSNGNQSLTNQLVNNDTQTQANVKTLQNQAAFQIFKGATDAQQSIVIRKQILSNYTAEKDSYDVTTSCIANRLSIAQSRQNDPTDPSGTQQNISYLQNQLDTINATTQKISQSIFSTQDDIANASNAVTTYQNWSKQIQDALTLDIANNLTNKFQAQALALPYDKSSDPVAAQGELVLANNDIKNLENTRTAFQNICNGR